MFGPSALILSVCFMSVVAISTFGQIPGGLSETTATRLGGTSYITGTVYWPSGVPVNVRMGIRLTSPTAGDFITTTDDRGQFIFSGLVEGNYSIVIDREQDFESLTQLVEVLQSRGGKAQPYTVSIRLIDKAKPNLKPTVIRAENARVSKRATEYYSRALELSAKKDHKAAVEQLRLAVAEAPEYLTALNEMGVQYLRLNELEKADEALTAALKIDPAAFEPLVNRGIAVFRLKRYADAAPVLRRAVEKRSDSPVAHYYLGRTLTNLEQFEEAERELNSAITFGGSEMKEAHRMLATMFIAKGDNKKAVASLEMYLTLVPTAPDAAHLREVISQLKSTPPTSKPL